MDSGRASTADGGATVPAQEMAHLIHDLNGLLSPIVGFAELLAAGTLPEANRRAALRAVGQAGEALSARLRRARAELLTSP